MPSSATSWLLTGWPLMYAGEPTGCPETDKLVMKARNIAAKQVFEEADMLNINPNILSNAALVVPLKFRIYQKVY
jgi:hypothetical protein